MHRRFEFQGQSLRLFTVAATLLISLLSYLSRSTPNDDAYTYIRTAEIFLSDGMAAAFSHYQWAIYPILIASLSRLFAIDLFSSAFLLDALFYAVLANAYLCIIARIDNSRRVMILAAMTILVYPQINEYRLYLIRDIGFWAMLLTALWQFLDFNDTRRYRHALFFIGSLLVAATLRIEALAYLFGVPLIMCFDGKLEPDRRIRLLLSYTGVSLALLLLFYLAMRVLGIDLLAMGLEFVSTYGVFLRDSLFPEPGRASDIAVILFNEHAANYSAEYIAIFMLAGLAAIMVANLFNGIGGPFLLVLMVGAIKRFISVPRRVALPMLAFAVINLVIMFTFVMITRYLTSRYAMVLCIMLSLLVPMVLDRAMAWAQQRGHGTSGERLLAFFLFYCAVDAYISFGANKSYFYEAADWLNANAEVSTTLVTNNMTLAYETGRVAEYELVGRNLNPEQIINAPPGSLIAVEMNSFMEQLMDDRSIALRVNRVAAYPDQAEPGLVIYRRNALP